MAIATTIAISAVGVLVVVGLFGLVLLRDVLSDLAKQEARAWLPLVSKWIVRRAVQKLPVEKRDILEDMEAQLAERSDRPLSTLFFAVGVAREQRRIAAEARAFAPEPVLSGGGDPKPSDAPDNDTTDSLRRGGRGLSPRIATFERLYRAQFGSVASYFARRYLDPQLVADLTADTFAAAIRTFDEDAIKDIGDRPWTIAIARHVEANFRKSDPRERAVGGHAQRLLDAAETQELMRWIDVERSRREVMERVSVMPTLDREVLELVDFCGLSPAEAARQFDISTTELRVRLARARARVRRGGGRG